MEIWHYWIIAGIILVIAEIFTPGFLLASFGVGAFGGSLLAYFECSFKIQLLGFSFLTLAVFFGIRPVYMKYFRRFGEQRETGVNALIGKSFKVTEKIINEDNTGRIKIGSESWLARSQNNGTIEAGEMVTISKIEGSTAYVTLNKKGK